MQSRLCLGCHQEGGPASLKSRTKAANWPKCPRTGEDAHAYVLAPTAAVFQADSAEHQGD